VNDYIKTDTATSSVLALWTGEAVVLRRTVPPVLAFHGTGLPIVDRFSAVSADAIPMPNQVQGVDAGRGVVVPGIPPRGRPVRC
jgi:hypothetical protein